MLFEVYKVFNLNPNSIEKVLHRFFGGACLEIEIVDAFGKVHRPREWFIAPLMIIEKAIQLLISEDIVNYQYDREKQEIKRKNGK